MTLAVLPYQRAISSFRRKAITSASKWTLAYRFSKHGPWSFDRHPWTKEMTDLDEDWMGMKAAQMGFTEVCLNRALYTIDILKLNVLYILPSQTPDATVFSADRFDGALELSPHLASLFSDVQNVGHKRAGSVSLYLRGARSRSGLKSIPAALTVFDEYAEMLSKMVQLAEERSSGQTYSQDIRISTPLLPNDNIDKEYKSSSQGLFAYKCPHCITMQILDYDNCLKICGDGPNDPAIKKSHLFCPNCKTPLPHDQKGRYFKLDNTEWVDGKSDYMKRGFRIPQHYSFDLEPWKIARLTMLAQHDPASEAELYNSKYGLPKETAGARVDGTAYEISIDREISCDEYPADFSFIVIGIDVGTYFHISVNAVRVLPDWDGREDTLNACTHKQILRAYTVKDTNEVIADIKRWKPLTFCIDADPEQRASKKIVGTFPGIGYRVKYANDRSVAVASVNDDCIFAGRSYWLDHTLNRYKYPRKKVTLPSNITREHKVHLQNIVKHYTRNNRGDYEAEYLSTGPDHYGHADNYAEVAIRATLFAQRGHPENITEQVF